MCQEKMVSTDSVVEVYFSCAFTFLFFAGMERAGLFVKRCNTRVRWGDGIGCFFPGCSLKDAPGDSLGRFIGCLKSLGPATCTVSTARVSRSALIGISFTAFGQ